MHFWRKLSANNEDVAPLKEKLQKLIEDEQFCVQLSNNCIPNCDETELNYKMLLRKTLRSAPGKMYNWRERQSLNDDQRLAAGEEAAIGLVNLPLDNETIAGKEQSEDEYFEQTI
ncbi:hypothetical protein QE152_g35011 [Popillia japonica]|uniref:Uncharacterized protein n=1 Tax=Popillia japonica TaxID=7064 RepID=A0AAW1ISR7_POPJA